MKLWEIAPYIGVDGNYIPRRDQHIIESRECTAGDGVEEVDLDLLGDEGVDSCGFDGVRDGREGGAGALVGGVGVEGFAFGRWSGAG